MTTQKRSYKIRLLAIEVQLICNFHGYKLECFCFGYAEEMRLLARFAVNFVKPIGCLCYRKKQSPSFSTMSRARHFMNKATFLSFQSFFRCIPPRPQSVISIINFNCTTYVKNCQPVQYPSMSNCE